VVIIMSDLNYITEARRYIGLKEIKGPVNNSVITGWLKKLKAWWSDDETPWCGVFVAHCLQFCGYKVPTNYMRAKDWLSWGKPVLSPCYGCIAIFSRDGGGHVGFVIGQDNRGNYMVLGGNQSDGVTIASFSPARLMGCVLPSDVSIIPLPRFTVNVALSSSEA
jgi:uncharacterized protein (TIGR02594 family)